jgi:methionyl-tRNA formyltransferase
VQTVYLGTSAFAAGVLRTLAGSAHRPALVVTRPDRRAGRGRKLFAPPVAETANLLGLELYQPESVNDQAAFDRIAAANPETLCVCAFGALIKEPLLSAHEMLNVHPSLLPRWRGAAPIERAIMAGDERTGVSIIRLTAGLDSGPVGLQADERISATDTYGTLAERLMAKGGELLIEALDDPPPFREQDEAEATYADKLTAQDRILDPARPAAELARTVRALSPHIGAAVLLDDGTRLGVWEARATDGDDLAPGAFSLQDRVPVMGCADGALKLLTVQPPGRKPMPGTDYLRGRRG